MKIGELVRTYRLRKGLTQKEVSDEIGLKNSSQFISNIERSKCPLPLRYFNVLEKKLEIPKGELFRLHMEELSFKEEARLYQRGGKNTR